MAVCRSRISSMDALAWEESTGGQTSAQALSSAASALAASSMAHRPTVGAAVQPMTPSSPSNKQKPSTGQGM